MNRLWQVLLAASLPLASSSQAQVLLKVDTSRLCSYFGESIEEDLYGFESDLEVLQLVQGVTKQAELGHDFEVVAANVPYAAAATAGAERMVLYNQRYYQDALQDPGLRWRATSILAHEIAHQLLNHELRPAGAERRGQELAADELSGRLLHGLGATVEQATAALREAGTTYKAGGAYPPLDERLAAVRRGWTAAQEKGLPFAGDDDFPVFEWPPPEPSARAQVPSSSLRGSRSGPTRLIDVAQKLERAFAEAGYGEGSYYAVPGGFALVSQLEQISASGDPKPDGERWEATPRPKRVFSLTSYLEALFKANPGHYRIVVFIVTPHLFAPKNRQVGLEAAQDWLAFGLNKLPPSVGILEFTEEFACTALIYEFEQPSRDAKPRLKAPSSLSGRAHLEKARLWATLAK